MQIPTLCRTNPALQTVQGMTKPFLLRVGHPALPHLIWINGVNITNSSHPTDPIPGVTPFIKQRETEAKLWQTKQHKHYKQPQVLLWQPSKQIALSTQLLLNSLCPFGTKRCSEPSSQGKPEAEGQAVHIHTLPQETSVLLLGRHSLLLLPWIQGTDNGQRFYLASLVNKEVPHV